MPGARDRGVVAGLLSAVAAFTIWGLAPVYFHAVRFAIAPEILAHRVVWSALFLAVVVRLRHGRAPVLALVGGARGVAACTVTSLLVASNWLLYVWAVNHGHIVDSSLGYYVNPLLTVLLGVAVLGERLRRAQLVAVGLAAAGVVVLVAWHGRLPWISLALAVSFGLYGLLRKRFGVDPLAGLLVETALLAPVALAYLLVLAARGQAALGAHGLAADGLLAFAGVITSVPLLLFLQGVRRLRLATVGLIQYISPTCQLLLGVLVYREPFGASFAVAFACIWGGLAVFSIDAARAVAGVGSAAPCPPPSPRSGSASTTG